MLLAEGLAIAVDMLVSGGEIRLVFPALLGMLLDLKAPPLLALLDGALCVVFMSAVLLDCLLYHRTAAFVQGPLLHFLKGTPSNSRAGPPCAGEMYEVGEDSGECSPLWSFRRPWPHL